MRLMSVLRVILSRVDEDHRGMPVWLLQLDDYQLASVLMRFQRKGTEVTQNFLSLSVGPKSDTFGMH